MAEDSVREIPDEELTVRILEAHLLTGPRPGQCRCGWGDGTDIRTLGQAHSRHVAEQLRAASALPSTVHREIPEDDYRDLADAVIAAFNPPDDDVAEFHIVVCAVKRAAEFAAAAPCQCTPAATDPEEYATPCARCLVLGRRGDRLEER